MITIKQSSQRISQQKVRRTPLYVECNNVQKFLQKKKEVDIARRGLLKRVSTEIRQVVKKEMKDAMVLVNILLPVVEINECACDDKKHDDNDSKLTSK